ncbi:MAG: dethiobiotin synthase [Saprospiraceae bacterium]|nr:dethiobiotin synthase [Saprospiraceae bacterium]
MAKQFFVSGISTEIGKTVVSSILVNALKADYWKPVQSGDLHHTDSMKVEQWGRHDAMMVHPEGFRLNTPASPHYAAEVDGVQIHLEDFNIPPSSNHLIVEGAGGLMVPLNDEATILDLINYLKIPVILVSQNYLGSINHTLLSIEALQRRSIPIAGIVFNGPSTPSTESIIQKMTGVPVIFYLEELENVNTKTIQATAKKYQAEIVSALI